MKISNSYVLYIHNITHFVCLYLLSTINTLRVRSYNSQARSVETKLAELLVTYKKPM